MIIAKKKALKKYTIKYSTAKVTFIAFAQIIIFFLHTLFDLSALVLLF